MSHFNWSESRPPTNTWVWSRYKESEPWKMVKTCKHGCCVHTAFGTMVLPRQWYAATPQEVQQEQDAWNNIPSMQISYF